MSIDNCINCGAKISKEDKFCTNCGTKIIIENNYCINCGTKLSKEDNYCTNCGTKIDKSDTDENNHSKSMPNSMEKNKAKKELKRVVGGILYSNNFIIKLQENGLDLLTTGKAIKQQVEKEINTGQIKSEDVEFRVNQLIHKYKIKKEENKKLKKIDEIFESSEIKSKIIKNQIEQKYTVPIKDNLKDKIIDKKENMSDEEIKNFIEMELEKIIKEQEKIRIAKKIKDSKKKK